MTNKTGKTQKLLRTAIRGAVLGSSVVACLAEYLAMASLGRLTPSSRGQILGKWSARVLRRIGVQWSVTGQPPASGLIVSNHLSYLDILLFSAVSGCAFVAKREVRAWPGVGWIATLCGTIYVDRSRRAETHAIRPQMEAALAAGQRLVLFPEGTSYDGSKVLPFHSSLFEPAVALQTPVTAAFIRYSLLDGDAATDVCYWGTMILLPHLLKLLAKESIQATLTFSPQDWRFTNRKEAARFMQQQVEHLRETPAQLPA
ncbi:MAG: lysophospholipid acyltransferase family protein [Terriglobales bacterium]